MGDGSNSNGRRARDHAVAAVPNRRTGATRRTLIALSAAALLASTVTATSTAAAASPPGSVDVAFGTGGATSLPGGSAHSVVVDPYGDLYAATTDTAADPPTVSISKLGPDGSIDPTFGSGGTATDTRPGFGYPEDLRIAVDDLGRVTSASIEEVGGELHLVLRRLLASGSPDPAFGVAGVAEPVVLPSSISDVASIGGLIAAPAGVSYVALVSSTVDVNEGTAQHTGALLRFDEHGTNDAEAPLPMVRERLENGFPVDTITRDDLGRIYYASARNPRVEVRRYDADLRIDPVWSDYGVAIFRPPYSTGGIIGIRDVAIRATRDGLYVASDFIKVSESPEGLLSDGAFVGRLTYGGQPDPGWADGGVVELWPGGLDAPRLVDAEGAIGGGLLVVQGPSSGSNGGTLRRLDVSGRWADGFGANGSVPLTGLSPSGTAAVAGDHVVLVGGTASGAVARSYSVDSPALPVLPTAPTVLARGSGAATVTWQSPVPETDSISYVVTVRSAGVPVRTFTSRDRILDVDGLDPAVTYTFTVAAVEPWGRGPDSPPSRPIVLTDSDGGPGTVYVPITSCRLLDTRVAGARVGSRLRAVAVRRPAGVEAQGGHGGGCGVPSAASAIVAAVSAVDPSGKGYLRVGAGVERPPATTFVTFAGTSVTNVGPLTLGTGRTDLGVQAFGAGTDVVIDLLGYFVPRVEVSATEGAVYVPIVPCRIFDTRVNGAAVRSGVTRTIAVSGDLAAQGGNPAGCSVPDAAIAVEGALSSVEPRSGGFARLGPAGDRPTATVLNVAARRPVATTSIVPIGRPRNGGAGLALLARGVESDWVVDVTGYYLPRTDPASVSGSVYFPATPCRLADTRRAGGPVTTGSVLRVEVSGDGPVFAAQGGTAGGCGVTPAASAASLIVTAADAEGKGHTRVGPAGTPAPGATVVQFRRGASASGGGSFGLGSGAVDLRTYGGPTNQVVDLQGWFELLDTPAEQR